MKSEDFCHLHVHTTYSQLDGFGFPEDYCNKAKEIGFKYLACTDHGNIDGLIKFQKACKNNEVLPVLGCEGYITKEFNKKRKNTGHITLWIKNQDGFQNICNLLSIANTEGFYYKPRINFESLLKYHKGLIVGSACIKSFVNINGGIEFLKDLKEVFKDDLYLEIMPFNTEFQINHNNRIIKLGRSMDLKIIATNDCHYPNRVDSKYQEVMLAIQSKSTWNDPKRWRFKGKEFYLKSFKEMKESLDEICQYKKEYLTNTIEIAEKCCDFKIEKREIELPSIPNITEGKENIKLKLLCKKGYQDIFGEDIKNNKEYYDRFIYEYKVIKDKNFAKYFLIVWELCNWCRSNEILIGPGRGSVGGSLLAFLLRITSVDPIKHKLYFSRFINEERIDYPDIDIDFEDSKRHLVKEHLEETYGTDNIAGVSSFNRLKARAAIQDVARVFEVPNQETNIFTKFIDETDQSPIPEKIDNVINEYPECKEFANKYPKVIKIAKKIGGQIRTNSQHAAALIISKDKIAKSGRCVLAIRNNTKVINWEKDDSEYMGLMKLDALGLKLLSILSHCIKLIKENHQKNIKLESLNLNDEKVLKEISSGNNTGVFQMNTWAMTSLIKEMGIEKFQHIADSVALVRPGPMNSGMTKQYIERKHGNKWKKMHPVYEELMKDTYGLLVYQEQVMNVINKVAGLPYATADTIRKIIGKKRDKSEFEKYENIFKEGCKKTKIFSKNEAEEFWEGLQEWSRYGFNLAHSVEYAILGYWCAWLKYYYPTEFICSSLTFGDEKKKPELIEEAYRLKLSIQLPKVNQNDPFEWKAKDNKLLIPFKEIKRFGGVKAIEASKFKREEDIQKKSFFTKFKKQNTKQLKEKKKGQIEKILDILDSFNPNSQPEITEEIKELFKFRVVSNPKNNYPKLYDLFDGSIRIDKLDDILNGDIKELSKLDLIKKKSFKGYKNKNLFKCLECDLKNECTKPVPPSSGILNIAIVGEAPGKEEDQKGKGFVGRSGDEVWKAIKYDRKYFHVTNVNKCYPSKSKKPSVKQIADCACHLDEELKQIKPGLILAFGNTSLQFFEGRNSGISSISGKTTWNERYGCFIAWSIHPAATLHNPENKTLYIEAIKNFRKLLKSLANDFLEK